MSNQKTDEYPLLPKPKKFWAVCNRYYADGEKVQFSIMRGPYEPRLEGSGVVIRAKMSDMGRLSYNVKPDDKSILKRASGDEQREKVLHAMLEDLAGGPWSANDPDHASRQVGAHGGTSIDKGYSFNVKKDDKGNDTLERRSFGFSEMELMGWLRIISREMEVRLIGAWVADINFCSFCGNHANVVQKLIAGGHNARICNECVKICVSMAETPTEPPTTPKDEGRDG